MAMVNMTLQVVLIFLATISSWHLCIGSPAPTLGAHREYCQFESFNASCPRGAVIVMREARYGRLRVGRCVTHNYGYMGCDANVLGLLDRACSGRQHCHYSVPTLTNLVQPCPKDLTSYLEATYECVTALDLTRKTCGGTLTLRPPNTSAYILGSPVLSRRRGSSTYRPTPACPVIIRGLPGQRMNVTVYRFRPQAPYAQHGNRKLHGAAAGACRSRLTVADGTTNVNVSLCHTKSREEVVYTSASHSIRLHVFATPGSAVTSGVEEDAGKMLIRVDVYGCADLVPPPAAWVERQSERVVVRCNHTQETWYMTCSGSAWTGLGANTNCSLESAVASGARTVGKQKHFPFGLVVAVTIGVVLGVMFGVAMLITVFVYRTKKKRDSKPNSSALLANTNGDDVSHENEENYARRVWQECKQHSESPYGRVCSETLPHYYGSDCNSHMFQLQCSTHALSSGPTTDPTGSAGEYHVEVDPYGQYGHCIKRAGDPEAVGVKRHDTCPMERRNPPCGGVGAASGNQPPPSFATFKSSAKLSETLHKPVGGGEATGPRFPNGIRGIDVFFDKNLYEGRAQIAPDPAASPDRPPDVVTSSHIDDLMENNPPDQSAR